jgi:hypothetical protein
MGDGQECGSCRRSKRVCKCGKLYRVVATYIDRSSESDYAANLKEVRELERFFKRHGCDGLRVEKWVEGIGYVLHE